MGLFFTQDNLHSTIVEIAEEDRITELSVQAWAGQAGEHDFFCIGNDGSEDRELTLYTDSPDLQLSADGRNWYQGLNYSVQAGSVGDAVYLRAVADIDALEGNRTASVHANGATLTVAYFLACVNQGDTYRSQAYRFSGDNSWEIREFIEVDGEALNLIEYEPQEKPRAPADNPMTRIMVNNRTVREWCNPFNAVVGFKSYRWPTKGFVGDRDQVLNSIYDLRDVAFTLSDSNSVILAHDFEGFDPTWRKHLVTFSVDAFGRGKYQGTTWTLYRDNQEYALRNIRRVGFFKGQILFYFADLERIHYPGGIHETAFLPWNELLDVNWKPIDYVRSWSRTRYEDAYEYVDGS